MKQTEAKTLRAVERGSQPHWVGDGFPVRTLFAYHDRGAELSPFLLLDHGGPTTFPGGDERRGVGAHPHRGFETVTLVYNGEVEHKDSAGGGGKIGPGDVQWMTAASGLVHEEFHGSEWSKKGGRFHVAQLWVNLPREHKMSAPRYQPIRAQEIPTVEFEGGRARVIAGELLGARGPAKTFTPMLVADLRLDTESPIDVAIPAGWTTLLVPFAGNARIADTTIVADEVAYLSREGHHIRIERAAALHALLLAGEPIDEPIAGQGPFVMNTPAEIRQAMVDFHEGRMGRLG